MPGPVIEIVAINSADDMTIAIEHIITAKATNLVAGAIIKVLTANATDLVAGAVVHILGIRQYHAAYKGYKP